MQSARLYLSHALPGKVEISSDFFEGSGKEPVQPETRFHHLEQERDRGGGGGGGGGEVNGTGGGNGNSGGNIVIF